MTATTIDTSIYCQSDLYVCSNSSASCPNSGDPISSGQAEFSITLNDGPIQFLIDGSSTNAGVTYNPTFDTFSVTSQNLLRKNAEEFSNDPNSPNLYAYTMVNPRYAQTWIHLFLKQYLQVRPWVISMLSLNLLHPKYIYLTLVHIPNATCPNYESNALGPNTYISEKIKELSYFKKEHVVAEVREDDYYTYIINDDNKFEVEAISFLDNNILIITCLIFMCLAALSLFIIVFIIVRRAKNTFEENYMRHLDKARKFSEAKKENQDKESFSYFL